MPLQKLQFRPGIVRDTTDYTNEGGWRDGDKIRFRLGFPKLLVVGLSTQTQLCWESAAIYMRGLL